MWIYNLQRFADEIWGFAGFFFFDGEEGDLKIWRWRDSERRELEKMLHDLLKREVFLQR